MVFGRVKDGCVVIYDAEEDKRYMKFYVKKEKAKRWEENTNIVYTHAEVLEVEKDIRKADARWAKMTVLRKELPEALMKWADVPISRDEADAAEACLQQGFFDNHLVKLLTLIHENRL